jgi:hypothetical protein
MSPIPAGISPTRNPAPCGAHSNPIPAPTAYNEWASDANECAGVWPTTVMIIDRLRVPTNIPPGEYVLGWRWDCEEASGFLLLSAQINVYPSIALLTDTWLTRARCWANPIPKQTTQIWQSCSDITIE